MERQILLAIISTVTAGTALAATVVSLKGRTTAAHIVADRLARVALLGMGALVALLMATA